MMTYENDLQFAIIDRRFVEPRVLLAGGKWTSLTSLIDVAKLLLQVEGEDAKWTPTLDSDRDIVTRLQLDWSNGTLELISSQDLLKYYDCDVRYKSRKSLVDEANGIDVSSATQTAYSLDKQQFTEIYREMQR